MTNKELIQAFRECQRHPQCDGCELGDKPNDCCVIESFAPYEVINRLEALLAENAEMNIQIQKEICKRVEVEAENEHLREVTKMVPRWVSVSERLPENKQDVLAISNDGVESRVYPANYVHGKWFDCFFMEQNKHTTHWMPLPEPPSTEGVE